MLLFLYRCSSDGLVLAKLSVSPLNLCYFIHKVKEIIVRKPACLQMKSSKKSDIYHSVSPHGHLPPTERRLRSLKWECIRLIIPTLYFSTNTIGLKQFQC